MEELYNQTTAYITPTYTATNGHTSHFENVNTSGTYIADAHFIQSLLCSLTYDLTTACLMFSFAFLGICFTVYGLYSAIKTDHFVPVYIINIFICDLIQTSAMVIRMSVPLTYFQTGQCHVRVYNITSSIFNIVLVMNICFMVCISADRYIMTAHPVWYRNITSRVSAFVSVTVWIIFSVLTIIIDLTLDDHGSVYALSVYIIPYPLVVVFFVGTWRALARNSGISPKEQRRIMGTLALVLFIYTLVFLPRIIIHSILYISTPTTYESLMVLIHCMRAADAVLALNPLFDFLLYLVVRRDAKHILSVLFFCCRKKHVENSAADTMTVEV